MKLECITFQPGDGSGARKFISIGGIPFYCSSGENSKVAHTWFPCFGLEEIATSNIPRGYIVKPFDCSIYPRNVVSLFHLLEGDNLSTRFGNLYCLLISSLLGGGLWKTAQGLALLNQLKRDYPEFYNSWPTLEVLEAGETFDLTQVENINAWLLEKANTLSLAKFPEIYPRNFTELEKLLNNLTKEDIPLNGSTIIHAQESIIEEEENRQSFSSMSF